MQKMTFQELMDADDKVFSDYIKENKGNDAVLNMRDAQGSTLLMHLCATFQTSKMASLVDNGADVMARNKHGDSALSALAGAEIAETDKALRDKLLDSLLEKGLKPTYTDIKLAHLSGDEDVLRKLEAHAAPFDFGTQGPPPSFRP